MKLAPSVRYAVAFCGISLQVAVAAQEVFSWPPHSTARVLRLAGSPTLFPMLAEWAMATVQNYTFNYSLGGSTAGETRICSDRSSGDHVDIAAVSRDWHPEKAQVLDDGYTYECFGSRNRVTQLRVGLDGISIVVGNKGAAHKCLFETPLALGLSAAQLLWIFSHYTDEQLEQRGLVLSSVVPADNHNGVKEWSDIHQNCPQVPINTYGPGLSSGTLGIFSERLFSRPGEANDEHFHLCSNSEELLAAQGESEIVASLATKREHNCYVPSDDHDVILEWVQLDPGGISFLGYSEYVTHSADLTLVRIADDRVLGVLDTTEAKVAPDIFTITDQSYAILTRPLYLNVDNEAWPSARAFLDYGFSEKGMNGLESLGYVVVDLNQRAKMQQLIAQQGNSEADHVIPRPVSCPRGAELIEVPYVNQFGNMKVNYTCELCPAGKYKDDLLPSTCHECSVGFHQPARGQFRCLACQQGEYANHPGTQHCTKCEAGTYARRSGTSECVDCTPGYFAALAGQSMCNKSTVGEYVDGYRAVSPASCANETHGPPEAWVTLQRIIWKGKPQYVHAAGSTDSSACGCDIGYMLDPKREHHCVPCMEGLNCKGMSIVEVQRAYSWDGDGGTFRCLGDGDRCPAGPPGLCAEGRDLASVACSRCLQGLAPTTGGGCAECTVGNKWPTYVACVVGPILLAIGYWIIDSQQGVRQSFGSMLVPVTLGQLLTAVQHLNIIGLLSIEWQEPVKTAFKAMNIINIDMSSLHLNCFASVSSATEYGSRVIFVFLVLFIVTLYYILSVICFYNLRFMERYPSLHCVGGTIMLAFFVTIVSTMTGAMQCVPHPNRRTTVQMYPDVLCWEGGEHTSMVVTGTASLLLPIGFLAGCMWAVRILPARLLLGDPQFFAAWKFLFFRYTGAAYWYGPVMLIRNGLFAIAPVWDTPVIQIIWLERLTLGSLILCTFVQPWRLWFSNLIDLGFTVLMVMLLLLASFYVQNTNVEEVSQLAFNLIIGLIVLIVLTFGYGLYKFVKQCRKPFQYFICHHKEGAGSFARMLKISLARHKAVSGKVFIDSDDLRDLDALFDYVANQTETVVVLCSEMVLTRPWCLGEIATAYYNGVSVIPVYFHSVARPRHSFIDSVRNSTEESACLVESGLDPESVQTAIVWLRTLPSIRIQKYLNKATINSLTTAITGFRMGRRGFHEDMVLPEQDDTEPPPSQEASVIVLCDTSTYEAAATAHILKDLLVVAGTAHNNTAAPIVASPSWREWPDHTEALLLLCTRGIFEQNFILEVLVKAHERDDPVVPILAEVGFMFPTKDTLVPMLSVESRKLDDDTKDTLLKVIPALFKEIAIVFQPSHYSFTEATLHTKAGEVLKRMNHVPGIRSRALSTSDLSPTRSRLNSSPTSSLGNHSASGLFPNLAKSPRRRTISGSKKSAQTLPKHSEGRSSGGNSASHSTNVGAVGQSEARTVTEGPATSSPGRQNSLPDQDQELERQGSSGRQLLEDGRKCVTLQIPMVSPRHAGISSRIEELPEYGVDEEYHDLVEAVHTTLPASLGGWSDFGRSPNGSGEGPSVSTDVPDDRPGSRDGHARNGTTELRVVPL